ncbi:hypothetical protein KAW43_01115 [Candidatus Parcubacteria bacterium]|nr:hypothetical protein [Candidatus Parcubacteria bacterium]
MSNIIIQYLYWHYCAQARAILRAWKNFLAFNFNYWSVPLLLRTLFSYWHKYQEPYARGFDPKEYFETFCMNMISRMIGSIIRTGMIIIGIITEIIVVIAGIIIFLGWLILPIFLFSCFIYGFRILF